jgi:hypothetical protein
MRTIRSCPFYAESVETKNVFPTGVLAIIIKGFSTYVRVFTAKHAYTAGFSGSNEQTASRKSMRPGAATKPDQINKKRSRVKLQEDDTKLATALD